LAGYLIEAIPLEIIQGGNRSKILDMSLTEDFIALGEGRRNPKVIKEKKDT
jgi:hypothetical protein